MQMVSAILARGPDHLRDVRTAMADWMGRHGYESLRSLRGRMDLQDCPDPAGYEQATGILALQRWPE